VELGRWRILSSCPGFREADEFVASFFQARLQCRLPVLLFADGMFRARREKMPRVPFDAHLLSEDPIRAKRAGSGRPEQRRRPDPSSINRSRIATHRSSSNTS
jgi:hypothetical protein